MKHRHLIEQGFTVAAIEDILDRGKMLDWEPLITAIQADPYGEIATRTLELCERPRDPDYPLYGAPVFRRVIAAARKPQPSRITSEKRSFLRRIGKPEKRCPKTG